MKSWFFASMLWTLLSATACTLDCQAIVLPMVVVRLGAEMPMMLEGGCFVTGLKEGGPESRDGIRIWRHVTRKVGAESISLRILEFPPGRSGELRNGRCDEVLYVIEGAGTLLLDGAQYQIETDSALFVGPDKSFSVLNNSSGSITIVSSQCPEPAPSSGRVPASSLCGHTCVPTLNPIVRLHDRGPEATPHRWYRMLLDTELRSDESS